MLHSGKKKKAQRENKRQIIEKKKQPNEKKKFDFSPLDNWNLYAMAFESTVTNYKCFILKMNALRTIYHHLFFPAQTWISKNRDTFLKFRTIFWDEVITWALDSLYRVNVALGDRLITRYLRYSFNFYWNIFKLDELFS